MCKWNERCLIIDKSLYTIEEEDIEQKKGDGLEKEMDVILKDLI